MAQLGDILRQRGLINDAQLSRALALQTRSHCRLGDILIGQGMISYLALYQAVAAHFGLPFVDLLKEPPEPHLLNQAQAETYLELRALPWRRQNGKITVATCDLSKEVIVWAKQQFGPDVQFAITSPVDIRRTVEHHFSGMLEISSRLSLWQKRPQSSARTTLPPRQKQILLATLLMATAGIGIWPALIALSFVLFCHIVYGATMLFKCLIFTRATEAVPQINWQRKLAALDERTLPLYTVLVPMYRESESLPGLLEAMQRLDYPASRLDIKLVLEADDHETLQAAYALKPRYHFDIIRVPPGNPRTKPRACNYALRFARGELVTVFDVDDRPEKLQLKKAVQAFRDLPTDVVCLQARLNYYNANENWLTRFFSLEYTILFHFMLYGLERIGIPIPLGGTSNHISLARLKELGEWDPYNVTEDADLGTRLAARGMRTVMLDSYTMEESPNRMGAWIRQRSRWIKGYMQTWLVHMRHPARLYRTLGFKGFVGFQFFVGLSCFTYLTAPIVWMLSLLWIMQPHLVILPDWVMGLAIANLTFNIGMHWYLALYCAILYRRHIGPMLLCALIYPLYLILHSVASYRALWQLIVNPHFWEKTTHGLARYIDPLAADSEVAQRS
jgi:glycosyltransferase XagB